MNSNQILALLGVAPKSPEEGILRLLVELSVEACGADEGSLLIYDPIQEDLVFAMTSDDDSESTLVGQRVKLGQGVTGLAAATREVQSGTPVLKNIEQADDHRGEKGTPYGVIAAPMLLDEELIGVVTAVTFDSNKRFIGRDIRIFSRAATIAAVVVEQRRALDSLKALNGGHSLPPPRTEEERMQRRVGSLIGELSEHVGSRSSELVAMLENLVAIVRS